MITVMVIEDDPAISIGIKEMLVNQYYKVITVADGIKGLLKTLSINPSIVILDINLPGLNGFDICKKLRENNFNNPIIMLTARSEEIDKVLGLEIGADDYLTKPFSSRELLARVRVQLRNTRRIEDFNGLHGNIGKDRKKLLTIMFTDMKDYSKIMNQNEDRAILTLKKHNEILNSYINEFYGRVVETFGDGYLVSFESAVNAANCSYSIQKALKEYNKNKSSGEKIELRIGIHLGDVIKFEEKLKGDTLNIAARIQQNTNPGEINISQNVYDSIKNKVKFKILQKGAQKFKNIEEPVLIFSIPI